MYNKDLLSNQRILVTGGGSGLGLAIALRCAELGATVAICGRSDDRLQAAVETAHQQGSKLLALSADVRDATQVAQMFEALDQQIGGVTSLVNNAAGNFYCASEELTPNGFRAVIDTVLHGTFHCTTEFGRRSISANRPGNILNIVTTYTQTGSAFVLPSACAKAGVYAMTTSLAWEWAEYQLRVNAIAPGPIPTEGAWKRLMPDDAFAERYRETLPLKRFGTPLELANLAVFLLSDLSSYISGECIAIDGAEHLKNGQFNFLTKLMPRPQLKQLFGSMKTKTKSA